MLAKIEELHRILRQLRQLHALAVSTCVVRNLTALFCR
jgi:hypothetical protein